MCYNTTRQSSANFIGESYSGSIAVSKTVHGGSNPSSPVLKCSKIKELKRVVIKKAILELILK